MLGPGTFVAMQDWLYQGGPDGPPEWIEPRYTLNGPGASVQLTVVAEPVCVTWTVLFTTTGCGPGGVFVQIPPTQ